MFKRFMKDDSGVSATEYAICLALITLISMGAIIILSTAMSNGMKFIAGNIG